jgi:dTDP-4-amino-4,6-dideoxygalactose transaminase
MTTDADLAGEPRAFSADHPVDDRYQPGERGELEEVAEVLREGFLSGGAPVVARYERALAQHFGSAHAVAVNSGSSALHAALHVLGIGRGTEVMVPAVAPLPTAMPILSTEATPVMVDVLPGSLELDPADVARKLSSRTRAAIVVPLWGYPADTRSVEAVLAEAEVPIIEDAAQAHGTRVRNRYAGTLGVVGCFSTHDRKLLSTGEGGFVLSDSPDLYERIEHYTRLGHLSGRTHGVNYKLAAPLAAIGLRRLVLLADQLKARRKHARRILEALPKGGALRELKYGFQALPNYYNLVLITSTADPDVTRRFADAGLPPDSLRYGYRPLYHQPIFHPHSRPCPNAEALAAAAVQLPVHPGLSESEVAWIARSVATIAKNHSQPT